MTSAAAALATAIADTPTPIALFDAETLRLVRSSSGLKRLRPSLRNFAELFSPDLQDVAIKEFRAVGSGRFDGLHGRRTLVDADGEDVEGQLWLRLIGDGDRRLVALVFLPDDAERGGEAHQALIVDGASDVALLVTDHDWVLRFVSRDIGAILGEAPENTIEKPLLSIVHPATAAELLLAITRAIATRRGVFTNIQLKVRSTWTNVTGWVEPLCDHSPPRLGIVLTRAGKPRDGSATNAVRLEQHLWRIAAEILAAGVLPAADAERHLPESGELAKLPPHQWEITVRLVNGERVPAIAKAMHLSPSTVRNHLATVYRRFGVHSQGELIARLRRPPGTSS
ncbi:MAG: LuxR C-terminal-related transcriptional regulator [Actinomycetota bacterium]